jgi:predicted GTPase
MMQLFKLVDYRRVLALLLVLLPVAALLPLGGLWLWQSGWLFWWIAGLLVCSLASYGLHYWLARTGTRLLAEEAVTRSDASWPPRAQGAWALVERMAEGVRPEDGPLGGEHLLMLGQNTLKAVAQYYHPQRKRPLLELTFPHTLLIIERASRDLRTTVSEHVPFSHQLTLGDLMRVWRWKLPANLAMKLYRAGRLLLNPVNALVSETSIYVRGRAYASAWTEVQRWLLREYVRKVGYYAIELYSGRLTLGDKGPEGAATSVSRADLERAAANAVSLEPLRILVLGRANAGKSSLINALFGQLITATDLLPDTTAALTPYRLEREGLTTALVFDTPGAGTPLLDDKTLLGAALSADLVLWVTAAHRPDRQPDRQRLDALRAALATRLDRRPPPLMVVLSHIDQLRPHREWQPPYDLRDPQGTKAKNIRDAVVAVAEDLAVAVADVVPVCLAPRRIYNVDDALWAALLERQDEADRVRLLRGLEQRKRDENWRLLRKQLLNAGRLLVGVPGRVLR